MKKRKKEKDDKREDVDKYYLKRNNNDNKAKKTMGIARKITKKGKDKEEKITTEKVLIIIKEITITKKENL